MKKRKNYFTIHPNKMKRKSIRKKDRWVNPAFALMAMTTASSLAQMEIVKSQPIAPKFAQGKAAPSFIEPNTALAKMNKQAKVASIAVDTYTKVAGIAKKIKYYSFVDTGRYERRSA